MDTDRLITTYMHHYHNTRTTPSWHHILEHNTDTLSAISGHWRPHFSYISGLLYLHSSTLGSAVSHGYYRQIRPIAVNPDWDWDRSLLHCLTQPLAIEGCHSRYWSFSRIPGMVSGQPCPALLLGPVIPASRMEFYVGWSLHGLAKASAVGKRCRTPGAPLFFLSLSQ
jgi:hypothetical protein